MTPTLEVRHLSKRFAATQALEDVSLSFHAGKVHAVVGENGAGKSTLMNLIAGVHQPDAGALLLEGAPVRFRSPHDALSRGIGFVHQEMALCQHVSVAENVFMAQVDGGRSLIDFRELQARAAGLLAQFGAHVDPRSKVGDLSVSQQQVVEIVKALSMRCKVIIFDEPTASLNEQEAARLFEIVTQLRARGLCVLYISHRLVEIFRICDEVSVLRDGKLVGTGPVAEVTQRGLVERMVGRELADIYPAKATRRGAPVLEVDGLSSGKLFAGVSFTARAGEIVGFAGLVGSGRTEVARTVCGLCRRTAGTVRVQGQPLDARSYRDAIDRGVVYLTEDRKTEGLFLEMSLASNVSVMDLDAVATHGLIDRAAEEGLASRSMGEMAIKAAGPAAKVGSLSGGNQQKVLISKLLSVSPRVVFMDEPTRGIDIGAKAHIYRALRALAESGVAVIVISSELPEVVGLCDRVVVMNEGRVCGEIEGAGVGEQAIMSMACLESAEARA
ncbi:MAG TPA: sugar ABC transporter ATP-binding protein [Anaeromyxobacteraceae bacterium]|nr:sugar ABC transporter ATP-binding protein [Anaeromyxobacteraceae bacterium]